MSPSTSPSSPLHWDLFCRVVDNLGDVGVCWRLAADLAQRGDSVRLVIDDPAALAFMAPTGHERVQVQPWRDGDDCKAPVRADVVIEAFGCDLPAAYISTLQRLDAPPVWLNLEYLSAEPYVERCHGLPSPQPGGLIKWFYYPGFTARTGGLLREPGLLQRRQQFDRATWLASLGLRAGPDERLVSLFCYDNTLMSQLVADLASRNTLLLMTADVARQPWARHLAAAGAARPAGLRVHTLPWLRQPDFDHLLWACDMNWVRGEDSLVRALWAGKPFVWQAYRQHDHAHHVKVLAMLDRLSLPPQAAALWRAWNGLPGCTWPGLPSEAGQSTWSAAAAAGHGLLLQVDLATQLRAFVLGKAGLPGPSIGHPDRNPDKS